MYHLCKEHHFGTALMFLMVLCAVPVCSIAQMQADDMCRAHATSAAALDKCLLGSASTTMDVDTLRTSILNLASSYLAVAVDNANGDFTCGVPGGAILLFGHPNPWSSATTIRIDGVNYWDYHYATFGTLVTAPTNINSTTNQGVWDIGDVRMTQNLQIVNGSSGHADTVKISYTLKNMGTVAHNVGIRVMLDTMLGANDGAPFRVPGVGAVETEREFLGASVPIYWEAFENLQNPSSVKARGTLLDNGMRPDRVVFARWALNSAMWDFVVTPSKTVAPDSAVGIYWNPVALAAGQSLTRSTYYGLGDIDVSPTGSVALSVPALTVVGNSYSPNPFPVTAYATNTGLVTLNGLTATLTLPAGLTLASGSLTQSIAAVDPGDSGQTTWSVQATGAVVGTLTISASVVGTGFTAQSASSTIVIPALAPAVSTDAASVITSTGARIGATVNPHGVSTAVSFDYGTTTAYGSNVVATPSPVPPGAVATVSANLTGLDCLTTYNYRVKAVSSGGTVYGANKSFTTLTCPVTPPTVTPGVASNITKTTAVLGGTVDPNGAITAVSFEIGLTTSYGTVVTATPASIGADAAATVVSGNATGLICNKTYHYRVKAVNSAGTTNGADGSFDTLPCPATVAAGTATGITKTSATLGGAVTPNGAITAVSFEIGLTTSYGTVVTATPASIGADAVATVVSGTASGLTCNTTYHYRVKAVNSAGTTNGADGSFDTLPCPATVTAGTATGITKTSATLGGTVTPNGAITAVSFEIGLTTSYGTVVTATPASIGADAVATAISGTASGLTCNTTYHYRVKAVNSAGTAYGADSSFVTVICPPPTVTASAATGITTTSATLGGIVTPNGAATAVSFEFGQTTNYGTPIAATPASIGAGAAATAVTGNVTGLSCNTTYNYRVKAVNSSGTTLGANSSFKTAVCPTDMTLTLDDGLGNVSVGSTLTYTAVVKNIGVLTASNAVFKAPAVPNLTVTSITCQALSIAGGGTTTSSSAVCPTSLTVAGLQGTGLVIPSVLSLGGLTFSIKATVAATAPIGTLSYTATVIGPSTDTNLINNTATDTNRVVNWPDLVVTSIVLTPASPTHGGTFNAVVTLKNQGATPATAFYVDAWANKSATSAWMCGAEGDDWADINGLAAGASTVITLELPAGAAGAKTLNVMLDSFCEVAESNELNNQSTKSYTVQ